MDTRPVLLIAGSDSSGGAGLEADQKVLAAHGCYAMTATTALTAQNTQGVIDIRVTPTAFVKKQIDACMEDVGVDVVKTGMLASADIVQVVADALREHHVKISVVDPVMIATSGAQLLPPEAVFNMREKLLPLTTVLTPNIPEAKLLLLHSPASQINVNGIEELIAIARALQALGPRYVLLKGGHMPLSEDGRRHPESRGPWIVVDVLYGDDRSWIFRSHFVPSNNTHGTGCSMASAIASRLVMGDDVHDAVRSAKDYVEAGIRTSKPLGKGKGPINHFHSVSVLPFTPGQFIPYLMNHPTVKAAWHHHTHHPFVEQLANGTLPLESFKFYLIQDYLYLIQFCRANALAAYKARTLEDINMSASIILHIQKEMSLHLEYCSEFGLSKEDIEMHEESMACTAYTRYILDVGQSEDWLALQVSFAPCLLGYGAIARRLYDDPQTVRDGNRYWKWIENYVAEDYSEAIKTGSELLEKHATEQSPSRIEELVKIFLHATKMEIGFWEMGSGAGKSL